MSTTQQHWDEQYSESPKRWSGNPNRLLVENVDELTPGSALELGCGEGADAVWLATQGWQVTAVDVSSVALARAASHAADAGMADRIDWVATDLKQSFPSGSFDLVCAQYLHTRHESSAERIPILRSAAAAVAPGGCLLIIGHAAFPASAHRSEHGHTEHGHTADPQAHDHHTDDLRTTHQILQSLDLDREQWQQPRHLLVEQQRPDPAGGTVHYTDNVLRIRRGR